MYMIVFFYYRRISRSQRNDLLLLPLKWKSGAALYVFSADKRHFFSDGERETTTEGGWKRGNVRGSEGRGDTTATSKLALELRC